MSWSYSVVACNWWVSLRLCRLVKRLEIRRKINIRLSLVQKKVGKCLGKVEIRFLGLYSRLLILYLSPDIVSWCWCILFHEKLYWASYPWLKRERKLPFIHDYCYYPWFFLGLDEQKTTIYIASLYYCFSKLAYCVVCKAQALFQHWPFHVPNWNWHDRQARRLTKTFPLWNLPM